MSMHPNLIPFLLSFIAYIANVPLINAALFLPRFLTMGLSRLSIGLLSESESVSDSGSKSKSSFTLCCMTFCSFMAS